MKRILLSLVLVTALVPVLAAVNIDRIEPANWFVGLTNSSLQLMVYGTDIRDADVTIDYPGVVIDSIARLDSKNYLFVYLSLADAQPGTMTITFSQGKKKKDVPYELKAREMTGEEHIGFTNKDVLYMLMPDRFADGDTANNDLPGLAPYTTNRDEPSLRHGGDIAGILQHLDYFTDLGVTALWVTPVLENNSPDTFGFSTYHGYATTDYYRVDPRFGTNAEYRQLVDKAHEKGLKVVMDMIFNHCGFDHPWMKDLPSNDWINNPDCLDNNEGTLAVNEKYYQTSYKLTPIVDPYASDIDLQETTQGWFVPTMPDLNQSNPHLMTYLIQNSIWWIETIGIDGIRMDTYPYAYVDAMATWMDTLNTEYPNFNVVGETWVTEPPYTATYQQDSPVAKVNSHLPTVMDFAFYDRINMAKTEETDDWWEGYNRIYNSLVYDYLYPNASSVMAFIENHDTDRFLGNGCDILALKQALALLLTMNRIPQLYYGTEILMNGTKEVTDGYVRKDFPGGFPGDTRDAFTADGRTPQEQEMFTWLSNLLHWRQTATAVTQGTQKQFIPYHGIYVLARQDDTMTVLTIINGTSHTATMPIQRYAEVITTPTATDILTNRTIPLSQDLTLQPRETLILQY